MYMSVKLSRLEQETIITFNAQEEKATIYSCDPVWMRKIQKIKGSHKLSIGMEVTVPKKWVKITEPRKLSPETKAKLSARMKTMKKHTVTTVRKNGKTQK